MSVWPEAVPASLSLPEGEGVLVSVSIPVAPRRLEALLDALAHIEFPINPRIIHDAASATVVEFPAYENHLDEVRRALGSYGFDASVLRVVGMVEAIQTSGT